MEQMGSATCRKIAAEHRGRWRYKKAINRDNYCSRFPAGSVGVAHRATATMLPV